MKPILKWVGGKDRIVERIVALCPSQIGGYYEPCCGGAAVFRRLACLNRFRKAYLSDANPELISTYTAVRDDVESVIEQLKRLTRKPIDADRYYALRASRPVAPARRAARMIALNHTCYKGLYRVNRRGEFNVPFGNYARPQIFDAGHLREFSALLHGVTLIPDTYAWAIAASERGDLVYLDPPYLTESETGKRVGFDAYTSARFDRDAHWRLAQMARSMTTRGVSWIASNAYTHQVHRMWMHQGVTIQAIDVPRSIRGKPERGATAKESLIWNVV